MAVCLVLITNCQTTNTRPIKPPLTNEISIRKSASGGYLTARQAYKSHDLKIASKNFHTALTFDPGNPSLIYHTFLTELEAGNVNRALELAKLNNQEKQGKTFVNLVIGLSLAKTQRWEKAINVFSKMEKSSLNKILKPLLIGWASAGLNHWRVAEKSFSSIKNLNGFKRLGLLHSGHLAYLAGDQTKADKEFQKALAFNRKPPLRLTLAVARYYASTNRLKKAKNLIAPQANENAAIMESFKEAGKKTNQPNSVLSPSDGIAEALFDIASALQRDRGNHRAMIMAQLALFMKPKFPLARLLIGEILDDRNQNAQALNQYHLIPRRSLFHKMAQFRSASSLQDLKRVDEAIVLLKNLAQSYPTDSKPFMRIGDLQRTKKRWGKAISAYDSALSRISKAQPEDWTLFYTRGIALERSKNWSRAEADFLKALELSPEQPYVMNYLGYSWTEKGIHLTKAAGMIKKAVQLRPNDGYIVDSLGWVLFRMGKYKKAVPKLERAVQLKPNDPTINDHLGDAYWRVGRKIEAIFQWQRAIGMNPSAELLTEIRTKLKDGLPDPPNRKNTSHKLNPKYAPDA